MKCDDENATDSEDDSANDILGMEVTSYDTENHPLDFDDALHCPPLNQSPENVQSKSNEFLENLGPQLKNDLIYLKYPPGTGMIKSSRRSKIWQSVNSESQMTAEDIKEIKKLYSTHDENTNYLKMPSSFSKPSFVIDTNVSLDEKQMVDDNMYDDETASVHNGINTPHKIKIYSAVRNCMNKILRTVIENDYKENAFVIKKAFELQQQQSLWISKNRTNG